MRIGYATTDGTKTEDGRTFGPTSWYRCFLPASKLGATVYPELTTGKDGDLQPVDDDGVAHEVDVLVLQRWMAENSADLIRKARATGQVIINDLDDWFLGLPTSNQAYYVTHPRQGVAANRADERAARAHGIALPAKQAANRDWYMKAIAASSALTVSTQFLADKLQERFRVPVFLVRNAIDLERFTIEDVSDGPNIGWTGGIPWRASDLQTLRGIIGPFLERHDLTFIHSGDLPNAAKAADQLNIPPSRVEARTLVHISEYPSLFAGFDVGLVPLEDVPFNHAKSCLKGMEYAACGIPFVAQGLPEYEWFGAGITVRKPKHWISALERLMDPIERKQLGSEARERVEREDIATRWTDWRDVYESLT